MSKYNFIQTYLLRPLLLVTVLFTCSFQARSTHILGGELYYDYLGNDQYLVTLILFRDCNSQTGFDSQLTITAFDAQTNAVTQVKDFNLGNVAVVPGESSDPCVIPPPGLCVERATYTDTITLPFTPEGQYLAYQRCCWTGSLNNMVDPQDYGLTLSTLVPGTDTISVQNNSARYINEPPLVHCSGKPFEFDHSAIDPDGDSLAYRLCDPLEYDPPGTQYDPQVESSAPYIGIEWSNGYDVFNQLGTTATFEIDSITGNLTIVPDALGDHVTGICVDEFRNGELINTSNRTFNFTVVSCDIIIPFSIKSEPFGDVFANPNVIAEDCGERPVYFERLDDTDTLAIGIKLSGTAENGVDYNFIEDTLLMLPGTLFDTIVIRAFYDKLEEETETIRAVFSYYDICNDEIDSLTLDLSLLDYQFMELNLIDDSVNICPDLGEYHTIRPEFSGGIEPYNYFWQTNGGGGYPNELNLSVPSEDIQEVKNPYYLTIQDFCSNTVTSDTTFIYNQCPIIMPNVVTLNDDGINELFIIRNREDYPGIELRIFNRWGELLYENFNYKDTWNITYQDGTPLVEGTYFYTARVVNDNKYRYDDVEETLYQATGFFQVIKD